FFFKQKTAYEISSLTGVQTCALPISIVSRRPGAPLRPTAYDRWPSSASGSRAAARPRVLPSAGCRQTGRRTSVLLPNSDSIRSRSEERRVGKEGSDRCAAQHEK